MQEREKRRGEGFTLIEILAAMTVFMIGVMGMVALQGVSIRSVSKGRQQTAAVNVARYLIAELKSEFSAWGRGPNTYPQNDFPAQFAMLKAAASNSSIGGNWVVFGSADSSNNWLRVDELLGHSGLSDGSAARFCVAYRVDPLEKNHPENSPLDMYSVWQIRVRVSWTKEGQYQLGNVNWNDCSLTSVNTRIVTLGSDDVVELVATATREFTQ